MSVRFAPVWLALACALWPGVLRGQVLYTETFNDGAAGGRWLVLQDGDNDVPDITAQLNFNYSTLGIAPAPRGTGTIGAKLDANVTGIGGAQGVNIYPLAQSFSGDFVLRFDVWSNVAGDPANSTEDFLGGINTTGTRTNWLSVGGTGSDGVFFSVTGNGGNANSFDYIRYKGNVFGDPLVQPLHGNTDPVPMATFPNSAGAPQNQWAMVDIEQINGVINFRINGTTFDQYTNVSGFTSGNIFVGHQDVIWTGQGNPSTFSIFDNVAVARISRWVTDGDTSWGLLSNWSTPLVNSSDSVAYLGSVISAPRTVVLPSEQTMSQLILDSMQSYTLVGPGWITLSSSNGQANLEARRGSHTLSAPVQLASNTRIDVTRAQDTLQLLSDPIVPFSITLSKTGAGVLRMSRLRVASLSVQGGLLQVASRLIDNDPTATGLLQSLSIAGATNSPLGCIDLANQSLIVDYATTFPKSDLRQWLRAGLTGGKGMISSSISNSKRLGYFDNTGLQFSSFAGLPVDATSMLIGFTFAGDANLDGKVDLYDLTRLATHWKSGGYWWDGDFNYDGVVNADDLAMLAMNWQAGVNGSIPFPGPGDNPVPEPCGMAMMGIAACMVVLRRHGA